QKHPCAEALQELSGAVEFEHGRQIRIGAGIDAAPFRYPDMAARSDEYGARRAHRAALRKREPVFDRAVGVGFRIRLGERRTSDDEEGQRERSYHSIRPTRVEYVRPPTSLKLPRVPVKRPNVFRVAALYTRLGSANSMRL